MVISIYFIKIDSSPGPIYLLRKKNIIQGLPKIPAVIILYIFYSRNYISETKSIYILKKSEHYSTY